MRLVVLRRSLNRQMHQISYIYQELEYDNTMSQLDRQKLILRKNHAYNEADRIVGKILKLTKILKSTK